jgi:hypothetical protein
MADVTGQVAAFPSPYYDMAVTTFPRDMKHAFDWSEYLFLSNGIVRVATIRTVVYFITELVYDQDTEYTGKLKKVLEEDLRIKTILGDMALDYAVYGNALATIYYPFLRIFKCPNCKVERPCSAVKYYSYDSGKFKGSCPMCEAKNVTFEVFETKKLDAKEINVLRIPPKQIQIRKHPFSKATQYYWEIPQDIQNKIVQEKDVFYINQTPMEILETVSSKKVLLFNNDSIHHVRGNSVSGFNPEWGCPPMIHILRQNYYASALKRANECIALDFVVPFRVISPGSSSPNSDPVSMINLGEFAANMKSMVERHRLDPADIQISPVPLQYQAFGAEKKALDVTAEIKFATEEMLHSLNYPAELFFNTLQVQALAPALRVFENTWSPLVDGMNGFLQWLVDGICDFMGWPGHKVSLATVTTADDIEKRQIGLQLAAAQQISSITAQRAFGYDFEEEQKKILEQQKIMMRIQEDFMSEQKQQAQMSENGQGGQQGQSPMDINTQAQAMAQEWMAQPEPMRVRAMRQAEASNPTLYAMAKNVMEKMRSAARSQNGLQNLQAMGLQGDMGPPQGGQGGPPMQ